VAIGPEYDQVALAEDLALLDETKGVVSVNECSVVLVVQFISALVSRQVFLPGDMEGDGMSKALARWDSHRDNVGRVGTFDVVKAPHHGSSNGHSVQLADRIAHPGKSSVLISCGTSYDLPSWAVLSDYLDRDWRVYCTSTRQAMGRPRNALQSTQRGKRSGRPLSAVVTNNLIVRANGYGFFSTSPKAARIQRAHLNAYI
jgi:beta-lactamase superfamily II metal-dependent hydrolase